MSIDYDHVMGLTCENVPVSYGDQDVLLYALGVGMGRDPLDDSELDYVFERGELKTVPSMGAVLGRVPLLQNCGYDYSRVLHGEQKLTLHSPLPARADLLVDGRVIEAYDKGPDKGALIYTELNARTKTHEEPVFTQISSVFARGDGGFGGATSPSPKPHVIPSREPDLSCELVTRADQALLYRLNGDRNPLHADPALAKRVGFPVPILHGLCTYGTACVAILKTICAYDHTMITALDVRFSAPVYPGETIITDMWRDESLVSFRCRLKEREVTVINNGKCQLRA